MFWPDLTNQFGAKLTKNKQRTNRYCDFSEFYIDNLTIFLLIKNEMI